jgi:uroporphyrinogen decarboxylase
MNSRQRVLSVINGQRPDRSPYNVDLGPDLDERLLAAYGPDYRQKLGNDTCQLSMWVRWPNVNYVKSGKLSWIEGVLMNDSLDQMDDYPFPDANDPVWYETLAEGVKAGKADKPVFAMFPAMMHTMDLFRGFDKFFMDVYDEPEKTRALQEKCSKTLENVTRNMCSMDIDVLMVGDDVSTQNALMTSPDFLKQYIYEFDVRYLEIAKKAGKKVVYHSDGVIPDSLVEILLDMGFDGIHPMQPTCNDMTEFARKYKNRLFVYGGLDNTLTIAQGSEQEIRNHIQSLFDAWGDRIILSSSNIMGEAKLENVIKLPEIIKSICSFA